MKLLDYDPIDLSGLPERVQKKARRLFARLARAGHYMGLGGQAKAMAKDSTVVALEPDYRFRIMCRTADAYPEGSPYLEYALGGLIPVEWLTHEDYNKAWPSYQKTTPNLPADHPLMQRIAAERADGSSAEARQRRLRAAAVNGSEGGQKLPRRIPVKEVAETAEVPVEQVFEALEAGVLTKVDLTRIGKGVYVGDDEKLYAWLADDPSAQDPSGHEPRLLSYREAGELLGVTSRTTVANRVRRHLLTKGPEIEVTLSDGRRRMLPSVVRDEKFERLYAKAHKDPPRKGQPEPPAPEPEDRPVEDREALARIADRADARRLFLRIGELEYELARLRVRNRALVAEQEKIKREAGGLTEQIDELRTRANELLASQPG